MFVDMEGKSPDITAVLCVCRYGMSITQHHCSTVCCRYGMSITRHHCSTVCLLIWKVNHPTSLQYCVFVGMECQSPDITAVLCVVCMECQSPDIIAVLCVVCMECQSPDITAVLCVCRYGMSITRHHCSTVCL